MYDEDSTVLSLLQQDDDDDDDDDIEEETLDLERTLGTGVSVTDSLFQLLLCHITASNKQANSKLN